MICILFINHRIWKLILCFCFILFMYSLDFVYFILTYTTVNVSVYVINDPLNITL